MTEAADLLAAIESAPNDDGPRLIYADWLDDRGESDRAAFIRVQIELARIDEYHPDYARLHPCELDLLRRVGDGWKIPKLRARQEFHRGFVESVWIRGDRLAAESHRMAAYPLVRRLRVSGVDRQLESLYEIPWLPRLTELDLTNNSMIRFLISDLLQSASLDHLRSLILRNVRLWPEDLEFLLNVKSFQQLTSIDLSGNPIGDEGIELLTTGHRASQLTQIILRNDGIDETESIHEAGMMRLAQWSSLDHVKRLDLTGHRPGSLGLQRFFESPYLNAITHLGISSKGDHDNDWLSAFHSQPFPKLRSLALSGFFGSELDWRLLLDWPPLHRGVILDLRRLTLDTTCQTALSQSPFAAQFRFDEESS